MLDGFAEIKICIGYRLNGKTHPPSAGGRQATRLRSSRSTRPWRAGAEPRAAARSGRELPAQAVKYIRRIEELIEAPVALLSTSPERDDTVLLRDPFKD